MKTLIMFVLLFTINLAAQDIKVKYDEFTGARVMLLEGNRVDRGFFIDAVENKSKVFLIVYYSSIRASISQPQYNNSWLFIDRLYLIVDGEQMNFKSLTHKRETTRGGGVWEQVFFLTDTDQIQKIATADNVRYSIRGSRGRNEGEFSQNNIDGFNKFYLTLIE